MLPSIRLDDLEVVIKVIECKHVTRVAAKLHKHQTTVTKCVQRVEKGIGIPLLDRSVHPVRPTRAAGILSYWGRKALDAVARGVSEAQRVDMGNHAVLDIGYTSYFNLEMLAEIKRLLAGQNVNFACRFHNSSSAHVISMVLAGNWDCGLILSPAACEGLVAVPIYREPFGLLAARGHPLGKKRKVGIADLGEMPLILPAQERNTGFRSWLVERCAAEGVQLSIAHEVDNPQEAWFLVSQNAGVALTLQSAAQNLRRAITVFRRFREDDLYGEIQIVFRNEPQTPRLASFVSMLLQRQEEWQEKHSPKAARRLAAVSPR
jgi:DNA-binding transcriptional LysR family regulator